MSFPRYPDYKCSGLASVGNIPSNWTVKPVKAIAQLINGYPFESSRFNPNEGHPIVRIRDLGKAEVETRYSGDFLPEASIDNQDVLIGMDGDFNVGRWLGETPALLNQRVCCVRASNPSLTRYLEYALPAPLKRINEVTYATTVKHLSSLDVLRIKVSLPFAEEEIGRVVSFLDRETAKIDSLIAEQQRLIELLQEKRQSVISHAVTKGLNPNAPMKDSGVEWLGEVPEHWEVKRMKHLCKSIEQGWSPQCENEPSAGEAPGVLKVGCVNGGVFRPAENKKLPSDLTPIPQYSVKKGDLLVSRANTKELVGSAAVVDEHFPWLYICDKLYRITVKTDCSTANYLCLYLASSEARGEIELGASGASPSMQNISQSVLLDLPVPLPQPEEQESIRSFITIQCDQIDELTAKAMEAIRLFQERRSALISAAVTGQIDVRGLVEAGGSEQ